MEAVVVARMREQALAVAIALEKSVADTGQPWVVCELAGLHLRDARLLEDPDSVELSPLQLGAHEPAQVRYGRYHPAAHRLFRATIPPVGQLGWA